LGKRRAIGSPIGWVILLLLWQGTRCDELRSNETTPDATIERQEKDPEAGRGDLISIERLPKPSEEIAALLENANVTFRTGKRPDREDTTSGGDEVNGQRRLAAETRFRLRYDFRSHNRWRLTEHNGQRMLIVRVEYRSVLLEPVHIVWFRRRPAAKTFWQNRLVRHELDHLRISSDPGLQERFRDRLMDHRTIEEPLDHGVRVDDRLIQRIVNRKVREVFEQIVDLVRIRYLELDRVTDHGLKPIPEDSSLQRWLR
jgi:hypothetical protein